MMEPGIDAIRNQVELLRSDVAELESHFASWDSQSTKGGRRLRSIVQRIVLSSKRLQVLVKENTYAP